MDMILSFLTILQTNETVGGLVGLSVVFIPPCNFILLVCLFLAFHPSANKQVISLFLHLGEDGEEIAAKNTINHSSN